MSLITLIPEKRTGPEFLDLPPGSYGVEELEGSLADIRTVNRYLGDRHALLKHLSTKIAGSTEFTLLDIATGSADLPMAVADWARKNNIRSAITGVDINEATIAAARKQAFGYPEIKLEVADGLHLPFPDKSFDFVICNKTTHHLTNQDIVRLLKEMQRVAKRGYLVMDLRRSWIAWGLIYLLTRIFTRNRLTRNDGPLSVLKSFTPGELEALASSAGSRNFKVSREPFWLLVLSGDLT
jgi:SAM-dependent methyltransferase